uniref:Down syndrome cell adhesion molecule n=1 Tax=Anopheles farauti TaxID=69004 RepID=A0A182QBV3_9DIPT
MVRLVRETSRTAAIATALLCLLSGFNCLNGVLGAGKVDDSKGPVFLKEPTNRIDFSNSTGAVVECSATGNPPPEMIWIRSDGTAVGDVPGLRQILPNGNLVFPPFRAEDYRQEVHAQVYACMAKNQFGSVISRDVNVRAVINQHYQPEILTEYVIRGNSAILKCSIPSFVADFVRVESWIDEDGIELVQTESYVVNQFYQTDGETDYAIRGNSAILKCKVPSFIADFVFVEAWMDNDGNEYHAGEQDYDGKYMVLPSGELHIREVGPEDGYKSYQCRTKHRLTGETRLSATKGRLVITEPVGSVAPRLTSGDESRKLLVQLEANVTMLCPAQSFPVPVFSSFKKPANSTITLLCQAQGFPVPITRWYKYIEGTQQKKAVVLDDRVKQVSGTLIIKDAVVDDSGKYLCVVNNSVGGESVETVLTVTAPLAAKIEPRTQTVDFGRPAVFTCKFSGNPIKTVSWTKDGKSLGHSDAVLRIESVKKEDKGMYQCFIRNDQESAQASAELKLGGRFDPPIIREAFPEETRHPGPSVFLKCVAGGNPTPEISWELDGKKITNGERHQVGQYVTVNGDVVSHLNITSIHSNDGGLYKCMASSKVGVAEHSAKLNVYGLPYVRTMEKKAIVAGETLIVTCPVAGYPIESIVWERDNRQLPINRKQKVFPNGTLIIENVERNSDQATYTCVAKNSEGYTARGTLEVQVMVLPHMLPVEFGSDIIFLNDMVTSSCTVNKGDFPIDIFWKFNDRRIASEDGITVSRTNQRMSVLTIDAVRDQHSGNYTCVAQNRAGQVQQTALLQFGEEAFDTGSTASVSCIITKGDVPIDIGWSFNGRRLAANDAIMITNGGPRVSILSIDAVDSRHAGNYTCHASNRAGSTKHTAELQVMALPIILPFEFGDEPFDTGSTASVSCIVTKGDTPIDISWLYNGRRIATNDVKPLIMPFEFGEEPFDMLTTSTVSCAVVKGDVPIEINWMFNGENLGFGDGITITKSGPKMSILYIDSVQPRHAGRYTCVARNKAGFVEHSSELKVIVPPILLPFEFGEDPSDIHSTTTVSCAVAKGDVPIEINWMFNGSNIFSNDGITITKSGQKMSLLYIESVQARHAGNYTCVARNKAGFVEHTSELKVIVPPSITPFFFGEEPLNAGESTAVQCMVFKGDAPLEIRWYMNGNQLPTNENGVIIGRVSERLSSLSIDPIGYFNRGIYECRVKNRAGEAFHSAELVINVVPTIMQFSFGEEILNTGDSVAVNCMVVKGDSPLEIRWYLNNAPISSENEGIVVVKLSEKLSSLSINSIEPQHRGFYECRVKNKAGEATSKAELIINVPPRWILEPTDKAFAQGSNAKVECKADGFPKPQVTWKKAVGDTPGEYKDLRSNDSSIRVEEGSLFIQNIQKSNEGYYLCEAINGIGSGLSAVTLITVQAPPEFVEKLRNQTARRGEPTVLQCEAKGEKPIGILWNMNNIRLDPKSDNRYTIREEILPNGVTSSLSIKRTERSDSALFTCMATNAFGSDDTSINMIIQEPPEMPYALKVLDKSGRTVQLSWAKPYDGNSLLKRYIIEFKRSRGSWENDIDRVIVPGDTNEAQVQKLSPATTYNIRIVAENDIGVSDPSDVVTIITAEEAPSGKPQSIKVEAINQSTLRVSWKAPPRAEWNGDILGYYVGYKQTSANALYVYETVNYSPEGGEGKEHSLEINNLKTYTQYSIVIQTFNKVGAGPMSDEEKQYTAEGTPDQPPSDTMCTTLTSQTIRVSWVSPPLESANGVIKGYKVVYAPSDLWNNDKNKDYKKTASSDTVLHGLKKYTNYTMQVLATTSGGDGVRSAPIHCQTEQDVPEAPTAVKALVMSEGSILVSWQPPAQPNGLILQYTVYIKSGEQEPKSHKVPSFQMSYEASGLEKNQKYEFWVTASTTIGEGQSSKTFSAMPSDKVPAKIASFDDKFTATFKEDAKLPCMAVGSPTPDITWKIKGVEFVPNERIRLLPEGSLFIKDVIRQDAGDYTCTAENSIAKDSITHRLIVLAPPQSPQLTLTATTTDSLSVKLKPHESDTAPLQGYTLHYKPEFGEWETIDVALEAPKYTIEKLYCGSRYQVYATAYNTIGAGEPSDILNTRTKGSKPLLPEKSRFIEVSSISITLHLPAWKDGGCRMSHFVVEHKKKDQIDWNQISNNVKPGGNFVVLDLEPATWYNLRVTAHNNAGFTVAEYEFATLTITGDKRRPDIRDELGYIAPPNRKLPPVPGSNYNTCDRVKRGTVISMEDEICPYATFHLLGFREEMDPTKAMNFQTFPHQNGMGGPGHMGTMGSSMAMQVPSHVHSRSGSQSMNRYARKNSQGGQSSIYTPAPEYDDPANCAEEDQYRRYTRINSQGGSLYCGPGPEYDDPANCAPEDDQYGSQYGGNYGTPYEHYGSRGSVGRRSVGSPEPPPPPPRNHDTSNSSFNDSKESNEISEAECDRDNGPRGNYGEPSEGELVAY